MQYIHRCIHTHPHPHVRVSCFDSYMVNLSCVLVCSRSICLHDRNLATLSLFYHPFFLSTILFPFSLSCYQHFKNASNLHPSHLDCHTNTMNMNVFVCFNKVSHTKDVLVTPASFLSDPLPLFVVEETGNDCYFISS